MIKLAVTGGKGGTGKSTISILLANKLISQGQIVVLCDCDVECPNDHLLLGQKLIRSVKKIYAQFPQLDQNKCRRCGLCAQKCRFHAIFQAPDRFPVFIDQLCVNCGLCWKICPYHAIKIKKKLTGRIFKHQINPRFYLVTGASVPTLEETAPIVVGSKKYATNLAKKIKADYLIFDTAAGLHCGVIRSLIGVDQAYVVTEATPLGAHDLNLILQLLKTLHIPAKIVVNQSDLGDQKLIDDISRQSQTEIAHRLPYSKKLVLAYSKGCLNQINLL